MCGLSNVMLPPLALVLMWATSWTPTREPSEPDKTALKVLVYVITATKASDGSVHYSITHQ
jgi:hypothetical protein